MVKLYYNTQMKAERERERERERVEETRCALRYMLSNVFCSHFNGHIA